MIHLRQRAQKLPPPPRPSARVLQAIEERIEHIRAEQGEKAALELAVAALAIIDTTQGDTCNDNRYRT